MNDKLPSEFEQAAKQQKSASFLSDLWYFLGHNKRWWLTPVILVLLLLGLFMLLNSTAAAPFIYTLF